MLIAARRLSYYISNPRIVHEKYQLKSDKCLSFYPVVGLKQTKTGIMTLNKPDNNNNVTLECADELFRFLNSYHHDHTVENVWIQNKGPSFSGGADYQQLLHNSDYLDRLLRLSIMIGQFNKPIFAKVHGSARGIGAYILTMFSTPLGTDKSTLRLDETAKGFIPIFGGSHRLSRLPCNIGIYLALTGDKLDAEEMARLGFLRGKVRDEFSNNEIHRHLSNANLWHRYHLAPSSLSLSQPRRLNIIRYKRDYFQQLLTQVQVEIFKGGQDINSKLALNQYRLAQADYFNMLEPHNSFTINNSKVNNYFEMRHDRAFNYLKDKGIVQEGKTDYHVISRLPVHKLLKIFNHNSVHEVLEELKKDGSQWAQRTEKMIRRNDPLAVHLTFNLIKKAKDLSWVECLEEQYKIARRILNISEINDIVTESGKTLKGLKNSYSSMSLQQIKKETIQQFFSPYKNESQIFDHDTPNHSFLPTSDYWRQVSDASRNYLNRTFFEDYYSKFAELEVTRFLNSNRIDYRDSSYSIPVLRKYMYKKIWYDRMIELERQRIRGIFKSGLFYQNQKQKRQKYLQQQIKNPQLAKLVEKQIRQYFESRFKQRFDELDKTAKVAGKESRMEIIRNYVKTLTQNIVMKGRKIEDEDRDSNIQHEGIIRFDKKNSDAFHAENDHQLLIPQLNTLKSAYKNSKNLDDIKHMNPEKLKPQFMFSDNELTQWEYDLVQKDAALRSSYGKTILPRQLAFKYRALIERTGQTSEQIAGLMQWTNEDIQSMIINSPKTQTIFKVFAEQTLKRAPLIEDRIRELNEQYNAYMQAKSDQLPKSLSDDKQRSVKNVFFDESVIPGQFKAVHLGLYQQVINFYSQKYSVNGSISNISTSPTTKQSSLSKIWAEQALTANFSKLMKNDVDYTFSYLVILHLKQILVELQKNNTSEIKDIISLIKNKFGIDFSGVTQNQFNGLFMQYLYSILDIHEESKHKIIFPQTKLIEFLNYFKINGKNKSLRFQSLMLLIAKDRKMIRDSVTGSIPLLGYTPELTLNILNNQLKQRNTLFPDLTPITNSTPKQEFNEIAHMNSLQANLLKRSEDKESLILAYPHYLRRFEAMLQQVAGNTMFLPKSLYKYEGKQTYELAKDLLKIQQSQQEWFRQKLKLAVESILDYRSRVEKNMSAAQLRAFDEQFSELFLPEVIGLVIRYECQTEEYVARKIVSTGDVQPGTNEDITSLYLDIKNEIKNPRALKLLNNLIMSYTMVRDRRQEAEQIEYNIKKIVAPTREQISDLTNQKNKKINPRTTSRLTYQALRYADDEAGATPKNIKLARTALGVLDSDSRKDNHFIEELKSINMMLDSVDMKAELENRIKRIEALKD